MSDNNRRGLQYENYNIFIFSPEKFENIDNIKKNYDFKKITIINKEHLTALKSDNNCKIFIPDSLQKYLEGFGLIEFDDFICEKYLFKKIVVFYGNCHIFSIRYMLKQYKKFTDKFAIYFINNIQDIKSPSYFDKSIFRYCDVFIHQSVQKNNKYGPEWSSEYIISRLKEGCHIISIPNTYGLPTFFYPQFREGAFMDNNGNAIFYRDSVLDEGYLQQMNLKEMIKRYESAELFTCEKIIKNYKAFIEKIKKREKEWDILISEFIEKNICKQQLFYEPNHPTQFFITYVVINILDILDVEVDVVELESVEKYVLDDLEMPMCGSVKNALNIDYCTEKIRNNNGKKIRKKEMDIKEYILEYWAMEWQDKSLPLHLRLKSRILWFYLKATNKFIL